MSNGGGYRMLIDVCQMVEDMNADWCMSNGGGDRKLFSMYQMVEDIGY